MELNEEQQAALNRIIRWLETDEDVFVLTGYAGTGKTTTAREAIDRARAYGLLGPVDVCLSAPTHKAVGVLAESSKIQGHARTIYSLLGCRMVWDKDEKTFEPRPYSWHWDKYKLVVLDEVSMVGDTIWGWVTDAQKLQRQLGQRVTKVLCLGDPAQLPPVKDGDGRSPAFELDVPSAHLTTIMRHEGAIQRAATKIRMHLADVMPATVSEGSDGGIVKKIRGHDAFFKKWDVVRKNHDDHIILCWRNVWVDWFNDACRKRVYGENVPDIPQPGEIRVMKDTHSVDGLSVIYTGSQVQVEIAFQHEHLNIPCWQVKTTTGLELYALRPDSIGLWSKEKNKARKAKDWQRFQKLDSQFCVLRPGYATTVHKSQGSTYRSVFACERDFRKCHDHLTRNMLSYVAYTRASQELFIF